MFGYWSDYYFIVLIVQIVCIVHALKTGRRDWLYLLIFLPLVGAVVYFIREILPEWTHGNAGTNLKQAVFSQSRIKELEKKVRLSDTVTNRQNLAYAYASQRQYGKAIELIKSCQDELFSEDLGMLLDLGRMSFFNEQFRESVQYYDRAFAIQSKRIEKAEDELIYAQALEMLGEVEKAEASYQKSIRVHHSLEAMYRYGLLLKKQHRYDEAMKQFQSTCDQIDLHPRHIRRLHTQWVRLSKKEMSAMPVS